MNAANTAANSAGGGWTKTILGLVILILVLVGLYYLYNFLYGKNPSYAAVDILSGSVPTTSVTNFGSGAKAVKVTELTGIQDGGQYSASFWIYVADTKGFAATTPKIAHLLEISNSGRFSTPSTGNTLLFVGLNPINGSLIVRQSTLDATEQINNSLTTVTNNSYSLNSLIDSYNSASTYSTNDRCDIVNGIEYQRWILVTVVGNGRTLDVYLDGKLARSCVYKANYGLGSTGGKATAVFGKDNGTAGDALKGYFASGKFYNYALTPDQIWSLYQAGPTGYFDIKSFFGNLFNVNISLGSSLDLNNTPT